MSERKCRVCGCVDLRACVTAAGPCYWVEPDLCSACAGKEYQAGRMTLTAESVAVLQSMAATELSFAEWMMLISALQLAERHPKFHEKEALAGFVKSWKAHMIAQLSQTPQLKFFLEAGDDPSLDVPEQEESRIIIPGRR